MKKIEHIGIAVKNLKDSNKLFAKLLGKQHYKTEIVESEINSGRFSSKGGLIDVTHLVKKFRPVDMTRILREYGWDAAGNNEMGSVFIEHYSAECRYEDNRLYLYLTPAPTR